MLCKFTPNLATSASFEKEKSGKKTSQLAPLGSVPELGGRKTSEQNLSEALLSHVITPNLDGNLQGEN